MTGETGFIAAWSGRGDGDRQGVFTRTFDRIEARQLRAERGQSANHTYEEIATRAQVDLVAPVVLTRIHSAAALDEQPDQLSTLNAKIIHSASRQLARSIRKSIVIDIDATGYDPSSEGSPMSESFSVSTRNSVVDEVFAELGAP